jgi:hypothetical protein
VRWKLLWDATPGEHKVSVRATDDQGTAQPDTTRFNQQGYVYDAVIAHPETVV